MVVASMNASSLDLVTSVSSSCRVPLTEVNSPFTFEIIMCLTLNCAVECMGSICQVLVLTSGSTAVLISSILLLGCVECLLVPIKHQCKPPSTVQRCAVGSQVVI